MEPTNNRVKTILGILLAAFLLAGIVVLSVNITSITVSGNQHYEDEEIVSMLFPGKWDRNTCYAMIKDKTKDHIQIPFVEGYKLVFQGLNKVEVIIYEKSVVGYVSYMSSNMYFDKDGIIVESTDRQLTGIPQITGLDFGHIVLHQALPVENKTIFGEILNLTQILSTHEIAVDRIQYDSLGQAKLYIGTICVVLGNNTAMDGKISEMKDQLAVLEGESGTLYLDNYDESREGIRFSFIRE